MMSSFKSSLELRMISWLDCCEISRLYIIFWKKIGSLIKLQERAAQAVITDTRVSWATGTLWLGFLSNWREWQEGQKVTTCWRSSGQRKCLMTPLHCCNLTTISEQREACMQKLKPDKKQRDKEMLQKPNQALQITPVYETCFESESWFLIGRDQQ